MLLPLRRRPRCCCRRCASGTLRCVAGGRPGRTGCGTRRQHLRGIGRSPGLYLHGRLGTSTLPAQTALRTCCHALDSRIPSVSPPALRPLEGVGACEAARLGRRNPARALGARHSADGRRWRRPCSRRLRPPAGSHKHPGCTPSGGDTSRHVVTVGVTKTLCTIRRRPCSRRRGVGACEAARLGRRNPGRALGARRSAQHRRRRSPRSRR